MFDSEEEGPNRNKTKEDTTQITKRPKQQAQKPSAQRSENKENPKTSTSGTRPI